MTPIRVLSLAFLALTTALPAQFTPGNLVVVRVGDGTALLTNGATAVFFDHYTPGGTLVNTVPMTTAVAGSNQPCTVSGTASSEGFVSLSADGRYLVSTGYAATPGTLAVVATPNPGTSRVVARTDMAGNIDTTTAITDAFSANNIRSAASDDGTRFWAAGANGGVRFATLGGSTSVMVNTTPTNNRVVNIASGQLYCSSSSGAFLGVSAVGTGLPTGTGTSYTLLPGFPTASGPSTYDFWFADPLTVYVADDRTNGAGGIQKWTFAAATWTLQYTLAQSATVGCRGLHGVVNGGVATLFATTTQATSTSTNQLVSVVDTGAAALFTTLATSPTNTVFRGLRRVPGTYLTFGAGCPGSMGVPGNTGNAPNIGTTFSARITNLPLDVAFFIFGWSNTSSVFGPLPFNMNVLGAPGCFGRVSTDSVALIAGTPSSMFATFNLTIPNNPLYLGTTFFTQGLGLSPGTNALGAVASDANRAIVGN